jgi:hypothetical protein
MEIRLSAKCADQAIRSTSAVYHIVKATALHGDEKVINEMARRERAKSEVSYGDAVIQAAVRHREIMALSDKGAEYKELCENLSDQETTINLISIPA